MSLSLRYLLIFILSGGPAAWARVDWVRVEGQFASSPERQAALAQIREFVQRPYEVAILDGPLATARDLLQTLAANATDTRLTYMPYVQPSYAGVLEDTALHMSDEPWVKMNIVVLTVPPDVEWISSGWLHSEVERFEKKYARRGLLLKVLVIVATPVKINVRSLDTKTEMHVVRLGHRCEDSFLTPVSIYSTLKF